ncbi:MAG: S8 family serine peptidase, partial [Elusimicrobiales bacterium]|nr:S8 family serine peptidase [Elusimicrobiales bacterium]
LYNYDSGKKFILVAATGNDGIENIAMPANCSGVVAVGASDESDNITSFSNYGSIMKINGLSAPGTNIFTTLPGIAWGSIYGSNLISGTSFSAPMVSAVMGAVWGRRPTYNNSQVINIVKKTARDVNEDGPDKKYGWGIVDMYKALSYLEADLTEKGINYDLVAWPNPFYISKHGYIKFFVKSDMIYPDDKLMIFDFSGAFVAWVEKDSTKGFLWDGKNSAGHYVAPGAYIAYYKSEKGSAKTKFVVLR